MSDMQETRKRVAERLSAAAQEILDVVERKNLHTAEMSPEQVRAAVQKQLLAAADEIFRILENLMKKVSRHQCKLLDITEEHETHDRLRVSASAFEKVVPSEQLNCEDSTNPRVQKTSAPAQLKDAFTETDPGLIHQMQNGEKTNLTLMETREEHRKILSSKNSKAKGEKNRGKDINEIFFRSHKRRAFQRLRQSQGAECRKMFPGSFHKERRGAEEKIKKQTRRIAPTNKSQPAGQSRCRVCGKSFWYKRSFLKHVLKHEQITDLCGVHGKHLDSAKNLRAHLQTHNEENSCRDQTDDKRSSAECSDTGSGAADGNNDKDRTKERPLSQKVKSQIQTSNKPRSTNDEECSNLSSVKYCCRVCGRTFCYRASFLKHVQEDERDTDLCGVCGKPFESEESLKLHLQTYIRTNECEVCGKHFDGCKQLEMHMRTHTGEKPYVCSVCGKAFAQNGNLMGHMRVHTGEKPYVCSLCGQSFSFKEYMMAHVRIHTGEKPFLCSVCGKGFRQRGTLKTHMKIHTGESTHRCAVCDKTFYKSGALKIHMRAHTGEKPYLCNVCGKGFTSGSSLTKHMDVHEGERTDCPSVCGEGFLKKEDLKDHRNESTRVFNAEAHC